jgi:hypothetical protein
MRNWKVLAVILAIVLVSLGLLVPAIAKAREAAVRAQCCNNLRQLALAVHNYSDTNGRLLPCGSVAESPLPREHRFSWLMAIYPYVEQDSLWKRWDFTQSWDSPRNQPLANDRIATFLCDARDPMNGATHYVGLAGLGADAADLPLGDKRAGVFGYDRKVKLDDIKDGLAYTLMVAETSRDIGRWVCAGSSTLRAIEPEDQPYIAADGPFGRRHHRQGWWGNTPSVSRMNAAFADGDVRGLTSRISPRVLEALATIAGGEGDLHVGY